MTDRSKTEKYCLSKHTTANAFVQKFHIKTCIDSDIIYLYDGTCYNPVNSIKILREEIQHTLKSHTSRHIVGEIIATIKRLTYTDIKKLHDNITHIACRNGLLDIDTLDLIGHTPEIFVTWKIDVDFKPEVGCKPIKEYMDNLVIPEHRNKLHQHIGNILSNHYEIKKLAFCVGEEDSGKSTLFKVIQAFLGEDNYCQLNLHQLSEKFTNTELVNKRLNICSDVPYTLPLKNIGLIKCITGGDGLTFQFKGKDPFKHKPIAKQFFSANGIPYIKAETDRAFYRRWDFIDFPNRFAPDNTIFKSYTTDEMKTYLLNYMIEGYIRLKNNGWMLTNGDSIDGVICRFAGVEETRTPEGRWLSKNYEAGLGSIPKKQLWKDSKTSKTFTNFCRWMLNQKIIVVTEAHPNIDGERTPCYSGIRKVEAETDE